MYPQKPYDTYPANPLPDQPSAPVLGTPVVNPVPQQLALYPMHSLGTQPWSSGLCDCGQDCGNCCLTFFCPCITFGRIAEIVDQGSTSCAVSAAIYAILASISCCHCIYSCLYRSKLRSQYSLAEKPCDDCFVHFCCESCALSQEYRELQSRGFDMKIGWHANMARQSGIAMTAPPSFQGTMRR